MTLEALVCLMILIGACELLRFSLKHIVGILFACFCFYTLGC